MSTASLSTPLAARTRSAAFVVLTTAATVWLLDALAAQSICFALNPACAVMKTWQGVGGAVLGRETALAGGVPTFLFGLAVHFTVALTWSTIFWVIVNRWDALARFTEKTANAVLVGLGYGAIVWIVMNRVVMPMTLNKPTPMFTRAWLLLLLAHFVAVGPWIVLLAHPRRLRR